MSVSGVNGACENTSVGSDAAMRFFNQHGNFDLLFSDPPWGSSNLRYFKQKAIERSEEAVDKQVTEKELALRFSEIFEKFIDHSSFILIGKKYSDRFARYMEPYATDVKVVPVHFWLLDKHEQKKDLSKAKVAHLVCATKKGKFPNGFAEGFNGLTGYERVERGCNYVKGHKMVDPCAGFGRYLAVGMAQQYKVYGVEICPTRMRELTKRIKGEYNQNTMSEYEKRC